MTSARAAKFCALLDPPEIFIPTAHHPPKPESMVSRSIHITLNFSSPVGGARALLSYPTSNIYIRHVKENNVNNFVIYGPSRLQDCFFWNIFPRQFLRNDQSIWVNFDSNISPFSIFILSSLRSPQIATVSFFFLHFPYFYPSPPYSIPISLPSNHFCNVSLWTIILV